jgi:hypothetical protein
MFCPDFKDTAALRRDLFLLMAVFLAVQNKPQFLASLLLVKNEPFYSYYV